MEKIIYTVITNNYDTLKEPLIITPGWKYICFTDDPLVKASNLDSIWEAIFIPIEWSKLNKVERFIKINLLDEEHDESIWIDASITINTNLDEFVKKYCLKNFTLMKHPLRDCIYKEAEECIIRKKDDKQTIREQVHHYRTRENYPENNGLVATGVMYRKNTDEIRKFCEKWWHEVERWSRRDQLSFNFVAREMKLDYHTIPFSILKSEFILGLHKHRMK